MFAPPKGKPTVQPTSDRLVWRFAPKCSSSKQLTQQLSGVQTVRVPVPCSTEIFGSSAIARAAQKITVNAIFIIAIDGVERTGVLSLYQTVLSWGMT